MGEKVDELEVKMAAYSGIAAGGLKSAPRGVGSLIPVRAHTQDGHPVKAFLRKRRAKKGLGGFHKLGRKYHNMTHANYGAEIAIETRDGGHLHGKLAGFDETHVHIDHPKGGRMTIPHSNVKALHRKGHPAEDYSYHITQDEYGRKVRPKKKK